MRKRRPNTGMQTRRRWSLGVRTLAAALAVGGGVLAGGCAADDGPALDRLGVSAESLPADRASLVARAFDDAESFRPSLGVQRFAAVDGAPEGVWWVEQTAAPSPGGSSIIVTRRFLDRDDRHVQTASTSTFEHEPGGPVRLRRLVNLARNVEFRFDPPVPVRPPSGQRPSDEPIAWLGVVEQVDPSTGDVERTGTGRASTSVTRYRSVQPLGRLGTRPAAEVRTTLTIELGPARIERTITSWFAPTLGKVATHERQHTTVLGIRTTQIDRSLRQAFEE